MGLINEDILNQILYDPEDGYYIKLLEINTELNNAIDGYTQLSGPLMEA
jgi:hypothetical protein